MTLWERVFTPQNGRKTQDSFEDLELPTSPGSPQGADIYDRNLHELVGTLLGAVARMHKDVKILRKEVRTINRKHAAAVTAIVVAAQYIIQHWAK